MTMKRLVSWAFYLNLLEMGRNLGPGILVHLDKPKFGSEIRKNKHTIHSRYLFTLVSGWLLSFSLGDMKINFTNAMSIKKQEYLTTIPVEPKILTELGLLKLKTFSLYHENLLLQKFNDMYTQVLKYFFSASDIMEAVRGCSHCCKNKWVGIGIAYELIPSFG